MTCALYHRANLESLPWHEVENGDHLKNYLIPLVKDGSQAYVANSSHEVQLLVAGKQVFPVVISPGSEKATSSYIVSNLCQYFDYVQEEILRGDTYSAQVKQLAKWVMPFARKLASAAGMEQTVYVNNWLFSSNLYPDCSRVNWPEVLEVLKKAFPKKVILFRGLDEKGCPEIKKSLEASGCEALSARLLYYLDFETTNLKKKRPFQQDKKRWEKQEELRYQRLDDLDDRNAQLILKYYGELYIDKHSKFNPAYSLRMLQNLYKAQLLDFEGIFEGTKLKAIQLIWIRNGVATTPFIGYDQSQPPEKGLYRGLNVLLTQISQENTALLNMSSGADRFKKQRGGQPVFEYNMLYFDHLAIHQRWLWKALIKAGKKYIQPAMLKKADS